MGRLFGKRLREERISRGLTQEELGGPQCSHSYISLLERGVREPSFEVLGGIAQRLGLAPGELEQWVLQPTVQDQEYSLAALHAWCAWDAKDYDSAAHHALVAAQFARESKKDGTVCEMNLLRAECLARLGREQQGQNLVDMLLSDYLTSGNAGLRSEALQLSARMALARQQLREAELHAQEAVVQGSVLSEDSMVRLTSIRLSIQALMAEGHKEAAWRQCQTLEGAIPDGVPSHLKGRLAWSIGDVAFARGQTAVGVAQHESAATLLVPQVDLREWLAFNLGSARARLEAGVADAATLSCLTRARGAVDILGPEEEARAELAFLDALWLHAQGRDTEALDSLAPFEERRLRVTRVVAEAAFLRGRIMLRLGSPDQALVHLASAQEGFFRLRNLKGAQGVADVILEISQKRYQGAGRAMAHSAAS